jgi:hypothetical protein
MNILRRGLNEIIPRIQKSNMKSYNKILTGVAGEYYVAAELSKRGYLASITLRNSEGIDILCSNQIGTKSVTIQVKTTGGNTPEWILSSKSESFYNDRLYYVFVLLKSIDDFPEYYVVPSKIVADYVSNSHRTWLDGKKRNGDERKDSDMRKFRDIEGKYKNNWDILDLQ